MSSHQMYDIAMINSQVITTGTAPRSTPISPGQSRLQRRPLGAIGMDSMTCYLLPKSTREGTVR